MSARPDALPSIVTPVPGPKSTELALRLRAVESRNITALSPPPIFWAEAWGANVRDADDNVYIDLTAGFGVAFAGHANPAVVDAIGAQARELTHGLGDVYPPDVKVALLEKLAQITPGDLSVTILGSDGADAVEAALKTAAMKTGRHGIIAFEGAYHGLSYGALATTWRHDFREHFEPQLNPHVRFAPFPHGDPDPLDGSLEHSVCTLRQLFVDAERDGHPIGAIIVEPVQGRGGIVTPPPGFLQTLRDMCDGETVLLIFDEIYTGMGRTGSWFASDQLGVVPDIITVGKGLSGSLPISAAIGRPGVMDAWPNSTGEAIHTSTFLGNPVACAAALAQISEIERLDCRGRARELGARIEARLERWVTSRLAVARRGRGLLQGIRLDSAQQGIRLMQDALQRGVLVLPEGDGSVIALTPPAVIGEAQLEYALDVIEDLLRGQGEAYKRGH